MSYAQGMDETALTSLQQQVVKTVRCTGAIDSKDLAEIYGSDVANIINVLCRHDILYHPYGPFSTVVKSRSY